MACTLCKSKNIEEIGLLDQVCPVGNFIFDTTDKAEAIPKAKIHLYRCSDCGFVFNKAFDDQLLDYSKMEYNNSQSHSDVFMKHLAHVEQSLRTKFDLSDNKILEVGCGDGSFLHRFKGENQCYGFDPATASTCEEENISFLKDFYDGEIDGVDLMISRHTFEHISSPKGFADTIFKKKPKNIYIEIPRIEYIFETGEYYALTYEHCSWYAQESLEKLLNAHGYQVIEFEKQFEQEFLGVYATLSDDITQCAEANYDEHYYKEGFQKILQFYNGLDTKLQAWKDSGKKVALWGVAGKGVSLTTKIKNHQCIDYCIDNNPAKDGMYTPINSLKIYHPNSLETKVKEGKEQAPDIVIITNKKYEQEIGDMLKQMFSGKAIDLLYV